MLSCGGFFLLLGVEQHVHKSEPCRANNVTFTPYGQRLCLRLPRQERAEAQSLDDSMRGKRRDQGRINREP